MTKLSFLETVLLLTFQFCCSWYCFCCLFPVKENGFMRFFSQWDKRASLQWVEESSSYPQCTFVLPSLGMTMEVLGTLIGAALQGQIVASAHVSHHCTVNPPGNTTDSWHHPPSSPDPSDPLSHQVSVCGSTLKPLRERGVGISVTPYHIQTDEHEHNFLKSVTLELRWQPCLCNPFSA